MDLIPDGGVFALMIAFGAVSVAVHAYGLYGTRLEPAQGRGGSALLDKVPLAHLVGTRSYNRGLLCYAAVNELLFLVLSFSSVILDLSLSVIGSQDSVGALALDHGGPNPMVPLLASSVIVTGSHVKPFSQIENAIRRIAHRVAGIPDGVYGALDRIAEFDFLAGSERSESKALGHARALARAAGDAGREAGLEAGEGDRLARHVAGIYSLRAWVFGADSDGLWDERSRGALETELTLARADLALFDERLKKALAAARDGTAAETETWTTLAAAALETRRGIATVFALLAINQPELRVGDDGSRLGRLLAHLQRREEAREINALILAAFGTLSLGLPLVAIYRAVERAVGEALARAAGPAVAPSASMSDAPAAAGAGAAALLASLGGAVERLLGELGRAFDDVLPLVIVFAVSALTALGIRAARVSALQWTPWCRERLPVRQYLAVALMATLMAFLFYTLYSFNELVVVPSLSVERVLLSPSLLRDFTAHYPDFMTVPLIGALCAAAVCRLADEAQVAAGASALSGARLALVFAAACGLLYAGTRVVVTWRAIGAPPELGATLEALVVPILTLFPALALFARWQRGRPRPRGGASPERAVPLSAPRESASAPRRAVVPRAAVALGAVLALVALGELRAQDHDWSFAPAAEPLIRVGVRDDAKPFSYQGKTESGETVLTNYRGYMVEICRRVLHEMIRSGPFSAHEVRAVAVVPRERFEMLARGEIDILCGPDSITSTRLRRYGVSHPMFVSGMTYAYVDPDSGLFPRARYCGNVVGVVGGTTAETVGLRMMAEEGVLLRFDQALEVYLALYPRLLDARLEVRRRLEEKYARSLFHLSHERRRDAYIGELRGGMKAAQDALAPRFVTEECPEGFVDGLPVRVYQDHDRGIADLCAGRVLYYVGDYDIIRRKIDAVGDCPVVVERFTRTKEVYGAFFRGSYLDAAPLDAGRCDACRARDALLYAVFNHTLLAMMQSHTDILAVEFEREFGEEAKSADLEAFFESFRITSDY